MDPELSECFSSTWAEARQRFLTAAVAAGLKVESLPISARGPTGEELFVDVAASDPIPDSAYVFVSGIHGVEGFAGSALTLALLKGPAWWKPHGLVLVHGANPFGMTWGRRVNENNVDLNRNFGTSAGTTHPLFERIKHVLTPSSPPSATRLLLGLMAMALRFGIGASKQAIVGGQFVEPNGLFYGGTSPEEGAQLLSLFFAERLGHVRRVVVVDQHTGLGPLGEDTLLVAEPEGSAGLERVVRHLGFRVFPLDADRSAAYDVAGGLPHAIPRWLPGAAVDVVTQELGTVTPHRVLHALICENVAWQNGERDPQHPARRSLRAVFHPADDERWRVRVLACGPRLWASLPGLLNEPN
jgi:hypothetical protein